MTISILKGDPVLKKPVALLINQNLVQTSSHSLLANNALCWNRLEVDPGGDPPLHSKPLNTQGLRRRGRGHPHRLTLIKYERNKINKLMT